VNSKLLHDVLRQQDRKERKEKTGRDRDLGERERRPQNFSNDRKKNVGGEEKRKSVEIGVS